MMEKKMETAIVDRGYIGIIGGSMLANCCLTRGMV